MTVYLHHRLDNIFTRCAKGLPIEDLTAEEQKLLFNVYGPNWRIVYKKWAKEHRGWHG